MSLSRQTLTGLFAVAAALSAMHSASATMIDVTYSGTVAAGLDVTGLFGHAWTDLSGDSYSLMYRFDTAAGATLSTADTTLLTGFGAASPGSAVLTIAGHTYDFSGDLNGTHKLQWLGRDGTIADSAYDDLGTYVIDGGGIPGRIFTLNDTTPFTYSFTPRDGAFGSFSIDQGGMAGGFLDPVSVAVARAVPEPSAVMLLVSGLFGFVAWTTLGERRAKPLVRE